MRPTRSVKALHHVLTRHLLPTAVNEIGAFLVDAGYWLLGSRRTDVPPTRLHFVGIDDFRAAGFEFLRYFIELGGLRPDEDVLDVGCGVGRMALPLTRYLKTGRYQGFDIVPRGIEWCQANITPRHPHFQFTLADIYNERYNRHGRHRAVDYRFPYSDASFDFVFLTSVFTHLLPADAERYATEIGRVLRPGGRVLSTWFLLREDSRRLLGEGSATIRLRHRLERRGDVLIADTLVPEAAIGFDADTVRQMHERAGLSIRSTSPGSWCGRSDYLSFQDIVVAVKPR
jgi:SAM-dependent methyltransferase